MFLNKVFIWTINKKANVANKPDTKNVRERTPPSELILFWSHVTIVFQGLSPSRSVWRVGENPGNEVVLWPFYRIFLPLGFSS